MIYSVSSIKDLINVIIPHFDKYPLITQKRADFELFKKVLDLVNKKEHLTTEGLHKILSIRASINWGLSQELTVAFPGIKAVPRPIIKVPENIDPNWLAGFTEGCFYVKIKKSKTHKIGLQVLLSFRITQHSRDTELMKNIIKYLECGIIHLYPRIPAVEIAVSKFKDISEKILPFFYNYPLQGTKALNCADFATTVKLMENKEHLTKEGLDKIIKIKSKMNRGRDHEKTR